MIKRDTTPIVTQENKQIQTVSMMELNQQMARLAKGKEKSKVRSRDYWRKYVDYMKLHQSRMTNEDNIARCNRTIHMIRMYYLGGML